MKLYTNQIKLPLSFILLALLLSCRNTGREVLPGKILKVLELAGDNRDELEEVLAHYSKPEDSLKLKAAFYLIENLEGQYHYEGKQIKVYAKLYQKVDSLTEPKRNYFNRDFKKFMETDMAYNPKDSIRKYQRKSWDSLVAVNEKVDIGSLSRVEDLSVITGELLIDNIDGAFKAWAFPWASHLTFDEFCEYILPYKVMNEKPAVWRELLMSKYSWVKGIMKDSTDAHEACNLLNEELSRTFILNGVSYSLPTDLDIHELSDMKMGKCSDANHYTQYVMRAMGVPIAADLTHFWANKGRGHDWCVLIDKDKELSFVGTESYPGLDKVDFAGYKYMKRRRAKIFRHTYKLQQTSLPYLMGSTDNIPTIFNDKHLMDVTKKYVPVSNVTIPVNQNAADAQMAYLCVFNNLNWKIVWWGKIDGRQATFKDLGRDIAYLPVIYDHGDLTPIAPAFILEKEGTIKWLTPQMDKNSSVVIKRKYPEDKSNLIFPKENYELFYWKDDWLSLGKQVATTDSLVYDNVPQNSLLWIRNLDKGNQERIFTTENRKQLWW